MRFEVHTNTGEVYSARNLAVATGLIPRLPDGIVESSGSGTTVTCCTK